jgi:hypothetical protein
MSKKRTRTVPGKQSEAVYSHLGPTNPRTLGSTLNHDHCTIPSSTFRTLEQTIPREQFRTHEEYRGYNPRTGKSKYVQVPDDLMDHARRSINDAKFRTVTSGERQRYQRVERKQEGDDSSGGIGHIGDGMCCPTPSILGGAMGRRRKDRY